MPTDYKILGAIGRGMTSQVYRAQDPGGRVVALKELLPEFRNDPKRLRDLEREVEYLSAHRHPNLMGFHSFDRARHRMVLEYMPLSLRMFMQKEPFHYGRRLRIALDVTEVLIYLHERGIVHKDLKPENIFLAEDGKAKLGDFGFAQQEDSLLTHLLPFGKRRIQGTISYLSPEQIKQSPLSTKSDIFSFGIVLYEMFTGRRPFDEDVSRRMGVERGSKEVVNQILSHEPRPPRDLNGEIDKDLETLILGCLLKRPGPRPAALSVKINLQRIVGKLR